jgi:hypothetical protein
MVCLNSHHNCLRSSSAIRSVLASSSKCQRNLAAHPLLPGLITFTEGGQVLWRPPQMEDITSHANTRSIPRKRFNGTIYSACSSVKCMPREGAYALRTGKDMGGETVDAVKTLL